MKKKKPSRARFLQLEKELKPYHGVLCKAADAILEKEVSKYPILIVHQQQIELGVPIVIREEVKGNWSVNASTLEEFTMKQLITPEKLEDFQGIYKDPESHLCLFVVSELGVQFIFINREKPSNPT